MIAVFKVYKWGYQLDVRFCLLLGCLQIIFLKITYPFPQQSHEWAMCSKANWIVEYKFIAWFKL